MQFGESRGIGVLIALSYSMSNVANEGKDTPLRMYRTLTAVLLFSFCSLSFASLKCDQLFESTTNSNEYVLETNTSKFVASFDPIEPYRKYLADCIQGKWRDYLGQLIERGFETWSSNKEVLEKVFGFRFGKDGYVPSTKKIIENYNQHMNVLVERKELDQADILRPAFFVKMGGGFRIIENPEAIPQGAEVVSNITSAQYHNMLARGFFPLSQSLLVHDLSHLTAFVSFPRYMANIKKISISEIKRIGLEYPSKKSRVFTINENLVLVRTEKKEALLNYLDLNQQMRGNVKLVTLDQMIEHLSVRTYKELSDLSSNLAKNFHTFLDPIGGGARDPYGSQTDGYSHINPIYRMMNSNKGTHKEMVLHMARIQIILIRLSNTTMEDWFQTLNVPRLDPASPVGQLFSDQRVWAEYPNLFNIFSTAEYVNDF